VYTSDECPKEDYDNKEDREVLEGGRGEEDDDDDDDDDDDGDDGDEGDDDGDGPPPSKEEEVLLVVIPGYMAMSIMKDVEVIIRNYEKTDRMIA
ncbi:hypothetical protein GIB67_030484, partial [Kingdonia uniflora]